MDGNFQRIIIIGTHRLKDNIKMVHLKVWVRIDEDVTKSWATITLQWGEILRSFRFLKEDSVPWN